jgi:radical SAM superfamily enzyme YgiQ (UPF0313 family)
VSKEERKLKVFLIVPKSENLNPPMPRWLRRSASVSMAPSVAQVVAAAIPDGVAVQIVDENIQPIPWELILAGPRDEVLAGITILTPTAPRAYAIADRLRTLGVRVVLGGVHPSVALEDAQPHADAVVVNEVEGLWESILSDFERGELQPVYRRSAPTPLEDLRPARWDLLSHEGYGLAPASLLEFSRGCPFDCCFCSATKIAGSQMRFRPIDEVIASLHDRIRHKGTTFFFLVDNNLVANRSRAREFARAFVELQKELGVHGRVHWGSQGSLTMARDENLLADLQDSGCCLMLVGIESLSTEALRRAGKRINNALSYGRDIEAIRRSNIDLIGCFVTGLDGEGVESFQKVRDAIEDFQIAVPQITICTPFPGTALREQMIQEGRLVAGLETAWDLYTSLQCVFQPESMTREELNAGFDRLGRELFGWSAILRRVRRVWQRSRSRHQTVNVALSTNCVYRELFVRNRMRRQRIGHEGGGPCPPGDRTALPALRQGI